MNEHTEFNFKVAIYVWMSFSCSFLKIEMRLHYNAQNGIYFTFFVASSKLEGFLFFFFLIESLSWYLKWQVEGKEETKNWIAAQCMHSWLVWLLSNSLYGSLLAVDIQAWTFQRQLFLSQVPFPCWIYLGTWSANSFEPVHSYQLEIIWQWIWTTGTVAKDKFIYLGLRGPGLYLVILSRLSCSVYSAAVGTIGDSDNEHERGRLRVGRM